MKLFPKNTDFIDIHSHHPESEEGVFRIHNIFSSDYPRIPADRPISIGLHPWHISEQSIPEMHEIIDKVIILENTLAIGETGLDRIIQIPMEKQTEVFRTQAEISIEHKKPLIIHCVKAFPELFNLRKELKNTTPWIIHGFNANQEVAAECLSLGIYISLSQRLFRNPGKAQKITKKVPLTMIFAETDEDPVTIQEIYQTIARLYSVSLEEIKRSIFGNFKRVFIGS